MVKSREEVVRVYVSLWTVIVVSFEMRWRLAQAAERRLKYLWSSWVLQLVGWLRRPRRFNQRYVTPEPHSRAALLHGNGQK